MRARDGCTGIINAFETLKNACIKGKSDKATSESIDKLSYAVSLFTAPPNVFPFDKLESLTRLPLVHLYKHRTELALKFSEEVLSVIIQKDLRPRLQSAKIRELDVYRGWENGVNSLLSGVLDFLEDNNEVKTRTLVGSRLMKTLCDYFFPKVPIDLSRLSVNLRCTAYMLLSDIAMQHPSNQKRLRESGTLGGVRLGKVIANTKDYAVLETLFNLLARLIPSSSEPNKQLSYIKSVFMTSGEFPNCGEEIVALLQKEAIKNWEVTSTKIIDVVGKADISMPQPFDVDAVVVCGISYPQTEVSDKFFVDRTSFFVNVKQEDDMYESLQVYFESVSRIEIVIEGERIGIDVSLTCPPVLADKPIVQQESTPMRLATKLLRADHDRFMNALRYRALATLVVTINSAKINLRVSIAQTSAVLEHDDTPKTGADSPISKISTVTKFYDAESMKCSAQGPEGLEAHASSNTKAGDENEEHEQQKRKHLAKSSTPSSDTERECTHTTLEKAKIKDSGSSKESDNKSGDSLDKATKDSNITINVSTGVNMKDVHAKGGDRLPVHKAEESKENAESCATKTGKNPEKRTNGKPGVSTKMKKRGEKNAVVEHVKRTTRSSVATNTRKQVLLGQAAISDARREKLEDVTASFTNVPPPLKVPAKSDEISNGAEADFGHQNSVSGKRKCQESESEGDDNEGRPVTKKRLRSSNEHLAKPGAKTAKRYQRTAKFRITSPRVSVDDDTKNHEDDNTPSPKTVGEVVVVKKERSDIDHTTREEPIEPLDNIESESEQLDSGITIRRRPPSQGNAATTDHEPLKELTPPTSSPHKDRISGSRRSTIEDMRSSHKLEDGRGDGQKRFAPPSAMSNTRAQKARDVLDTTDVLNSLRTRKGHHMSEVPDVGRETVAKEKSSNKEANAQLSMGALATMTVIDLTDSPNVKANRQVKVTRRVTPSQIEAGQAQDASMLTDSPSSGHRATFDETSRRETTSFERIYKNSFQHRVRKPNRENEPYGRERNEKYKIFANHPDRLPQSIPFEQRCEQLRGDSKGVASSSEEPGMKELIDVLASIQQAIANNIANKSRVVRSEIRIARGRILRDAAQDLAAMREESIIHLENLLLIEAGYASFGRAVAGAYDNALKDQLQGHVFLQRTISEHDRGSLSKRMPKSLFSATKPSILEN